MIVSRISGKEIRSYYKKNKRGTIDIPDMMMHLPLMHSLRLTDDEYDRFIEICPEEVFDYLQGEMTFAQKREIVKYLSKIV